MSAIDAAFTAGWNAGYEAARYDIDGGESEPPTHQQALAAFHADDAEGDYVQRIHRSFAADERIQAVIDQGLVTPRPVQRLGTEGTTDEPVQTEPHSYEKRAAQKSVLDIVEAAYESDSQTRLIDAFHERTGRCIATCGSTPLHFHCARIEGKHRAHDHSECTPSDGEEPVPSETLAEKIEAAGSAYVGALQDKVVHGESDKPVPDIVDAARHWGTKKTQQEQGATFLSVPLTADGMPTEVRVQTGNEQPVVYDVQPRHEHDWQPMYDGRVFVALSNSIDAVTYERCSICAENRSVPMRRATEHHAQVNAYLDEAGLLNDRERAFYADPAPMTLEQRVEALEKAVAALHKAQRNAPGWEDLR